MPSLFLLQRLSPTSRRATVASYTLLGSIPLVLIAALAVYDAEATQPNNEFTTVGDALWWSASTITAVGYGDLAPTSEVGRIIASLLMIGGIAIAGVVTALIAAWLVEQIEDESDQHQARLTLENQRALLSEIDMLAPKSAPSSTLYPKTPKTHKKPSAGLQTSLCCSP